jgi:hypothetical protein
MQDPRGQDPQHHHRLRVQRACLHHYQVLQGRDGDRRRSIEVQLR